MDPWNHQTEFIVEPSWKTWIMGEVAKRRKILLSIVVVFLIVWGSLYALNNTSAETKLAERTRAYAQKFHLK
eukprot:gene6395-16298_t